jgi:hypothetical protein
MKRQAGIRKKVSWVANEEDALQKSTPDQRRSDVFEIGLLLGNTLQLTHFWLKLEVFLRWELVEYMIDPTLSTDFRDKQILLGTMVTLRLYHEASQSVRQNTGIKEGRRLSDRAVLKRKEGGLFF